MDWLRELLGNHYGQFNTKQAIEAFVGRQIMWPDQQSNQQHALFNAQMQFRGGVMTNNNIDPGMMGATFFGNSALQAQMVHNQLLAYQRGQTSQGYLARQFIGQCSQHWLDAMLDIELGLS